MRSGIAVLCFVPLVVCYVDVALTPGRAWANHRTVYLSSVTVQYASEHWAHALRHFLRLCTPVPRFHLRVSIHSHLLITVSTLKAQGLEHLLVRNLELLGVPQCILHVLVSPPAQDSVTGHSAHAISRHTLAHAHLSVRKGGTGLALSESGARTPPCLTITLFPSGADPGAIRPTRRTSEAGGDICRGRSLLRGSGGVGKECTVCIRVDVRQLPVHLHIHKDSEAGLVVSGAAA